MFSHHSKRVEHKFDKLKYKRQQSNQGFIPVIESVTLDMKQQELDGRWNILLFKNSIFVNEISKTWVVL